MTKRLTILIIFCFACIYTRAQDSTTASNGSSTPAIPLYDTTSQSSNAFVGLGLAMSSYRGDLINTYTSPTPNFEVYIRFNRKKYLNGQFSIGFGKLSATNPYYSYTYNATGNISPNSNFVTAYQYLKYELNFNFISTKRWRVYISQGIGAMHFTPKNQDNLVLLELNNTRAPNEGYSNLSIVLPSSVGIMYISPSNYAFGIKAGLLNPQTDYLDNISSLSNESRKDNVVSFQMNINAPINLPGSKTKK